jgi:hypothetical protein
MSGDVCEGYSAVVKVMLCYSAMEVLCGALGLALADQVVVPSPAGGYAKCPAQLRAEYQGASSSEFPLRAALTNPKLGKRLDAFMAGSSEDVLPVATALRHLFVHGVWTPSGGEVVSKRAAKALTDLAQLLLQHCDTVFAAHVSSLKGAQESGPTCTYDIKGLNVLINTDDDDWFAGACDVLGLAEARHDTRFTAKDRRSPDPSAKEKSMRSGGVHFPALHIIIRRRLEALTVAEIKSVVKRLDKAGVPVDLS